MSGIKNIISVFFRISSGLIPFADHPVCKINWQKIFKKDFKAIGRYIRKNKMRASMHPDHFTIINSLGKEIVGRRHFEIASEVKKIFQKYQELSHIIAILGVEELSRAERITAKRAERLQRFLTQPLFVTESFSNKKGIYVPLRKTLEGCARILNGDFDNLDLEKLYMIGSIDEIKL